MKELINWLKNIEHLASAAYGQAALAHSDDPEFSAFLARIAEDEAWHYSVMGQAQEFLASAGESIQAVAVDPATNERIQRYFEEMQTGLDQRTLSRQELIEKIMEAELSEWNKIFLYVVSQLKEKSSEFKYPAARIQAHIQEIERFAATLPEGAPIVEQIRALPKVWVEHILIVDDESTITHLISSLLEDAGKVDVAANGLEALALVDATYYKLIICDMSMPVMDGINFYEQAAARFPDVGRRFLFMTGDLSTERLAFLNHRQLRYMTKPMRIKQLREAAAEILRAV